MDFKFIFWTYLIALGFTTITAQGGIALDCQVDPITIIMTETQETYTLTYADVTANSESNCNWIFQGNAGKRLLFRVKEQVFTTTVLGDVCQSSMSVFDGADANGGKILDTHCSGESHSIATNAEVYYLSLYNGFENKIEKFTLEVIQAMDYSQNACGVGAFTDLTTDSTTYALISTKGFPSVYKGGSHCLWRITAPESKVRIEMLFVDIDKKDAICKDVLMIRGIAGGDTDVCDSDGFSFGKTYTGAEIGTAVELEFDTDNAVEKRGFLLQYRQLANCKTPPIVDNAMSMFDDTLEGTIATYTCKSPYVLQNENENTVECQRSGKWTTATTECIVQCPNTLPTATGATGNAAGYLEGDKATYTCNAGFVQTGDESTQTISCLSTGLWETPMIVCQPGCFGDPTTVPKTMVTISGRYIGAIATYACMSGEKKYDVVCLENGMWDKPNIRCKDGNRSFDAEAYGYWSVMFICLLFLAYKEKRRVIGYHIFGISSL